MKRQYTVPRCAVYRIRGCETILTGSVTGAEIGGVTGRFDSPMRRRLTNFEEDDDDFQP